MAAIEREIERLAAPDLALEAEVRVVRELCAQIVDLDVAAADGQRGDEAVDGERAITAFCERDTAIRPEIIDGGTFAMRRDISMGTARQRIDPREGRRPCRRIRLHGCDIDIVGLDMCRIRLVIQRELALARDLPAEDARMDVLQVEHAVQEPCMRRNVLERNAGRLTRCDCDVTVYHRVRERAADFRRDVHGACVVRSRDSRCCLRPRLGNRREQRRRVESFSARLEIHGRRRRIEADAAMHACRLPLHGSREVAADLTVREMREALNIANLDALDIDRAVFDLALSDHREVADIGAAVERCFCRLDLAAQNPDAVRQQPIGNQRKVIRGIDVRDLDIQNLAVA